MTVGDELKTERLNRRLTQHEVAKMIGVNRNFVYKMELNHHSNTIYALHKVYLFFGFLPKTLKIDETTLRGTLFAHRIRNGLTYREVAEKVGVDKSTIGRFEQGRIAKEESIQKIEQYLQKTYI